MTRPVFIYGAERSGTTVFRLMLDAHPALCNLGEADLLFDCIHRHPAQDRWAYDLDELCLDRRFADAGLVLPDWAQGPDHDGKALLRDLLRQFQAQSTGQMSLNIHRHIDKVAALLPDAKVIHLLRDPRDVARSRIGMGWAGTVYHGVGSWIETERSWDRAAATISATEILDVCYEDLILEPAEHLARVCDFLGVDFDPAMLKYYEKTSYGPPDPKLVEQWRRKLAPKELAFVEHKLGPLLAARGYPASGLTPRRPGLVDRAVLYWKNKLGIWRFAIARYGVYLVLSERVSRWLRLHRANRKIRFEINQITKMHLK